MPIYEYACQKCGHTLDALQKVGDGALKKCPECGAMKLRRLVSAPQFRLKGSGWYETDFKKDGQKRLADKAEEKPAAAAAEAKPESKESTTADATTAKDKPAPVEKAPKPAKKAGKSPSRGASAD
ncbi:MAG: zinc ribbon domain-containing protein [Gammaproteobacteria bacterium]|nr:zinc ribbon domain-containing protein [Gammaproteobacteria bacterium]